MLWDISYTTHKYSQSLFFHSLEWDSRSSMKNCQQQRVLASFRSYLFRLLCARVRYLPWIACSLKCLTSLNCPNKQTYEGRQRRWPGYDYVDDQRTKITQQISWIFHTHNTKKKVCSKLCPNVGSLFSLRRWRHHRSLLDQMWRARTWRILYLAQMSGNFLCVFYLNDDLLIKSSRKEAERNRRDDIQPRRRGEESWDESGKVNKIKTFFSLDSVIFPYRSWKVSLKI